jgi:uncharacterized protein (DUF1697 family)
MTTYIALLRGINVGGKNIIKMAELKKVFEAIGLYEVQTFIQSGNVLFKSSEDEETLRAKIAHEITAAFGLSVTVTIRTAAELEQIILNCPFTQEEIFAAESSSDAECFYAAFLSQIPSQEKADSLKTYKSENDEYRIIGREVFLLFRNSIRNSKLANNLQKLDASATVRNWKTISKLCELAKYKDAER